MTFKIFLSVGGPLSKLFEGFGSTLTYFDFIVLVET